SVSEDRGAPTAEHGCSERWGVWGAISGPPILVALGKVRVPRGFVGDRVVVVGRDRAAHADGADDLPAVDDRHGAATKDELVVTERGDVRREELAPLVEALLEIGRASCRARGGDV